MGNVMQKLLSKTLREVADKLDEDGCEIDRNDASNYIDMIAHEPMSKESACSFLRISRATFDNYVRAGDLPRGKKRRGFKELVWYKSDLLKLVANEKEKQNPSA